MDGRVDREDKVIRKLHLILASAGGLAGGAGAENRPQPITHCVSTGWRY